MNKIFRILLVALVLFLVYQWVTFPDVGQLATERPGTTAFMELRKRQLRAAGKDDTIQYRWVPYARISPYLRRAVLVSEDDAFYKHKGVDVEGVKDAIRRDWKNKRLSHGGSTVTQQLAKNLYLSPSKNPVRKIKEFLIAREMEQQLSKKRILEIYLNVVEMGERVYGAEAASRHYFGKSASALTPQQAALLAGCLPNPRILNPGNPPRRLRNRQRTILSRMRRWGYLFEKEVLTEKKKTPEQVADSPLTSTETDPSTGTDTSLDAATPDAATTATVEPVQTETAAPESEAERPAGTETPQPVEEPVTTGTSPPN